MIIQEKLDLFSRALLKRRFVVPMDMAGALHMAVEQSGSNLCHKVLNI
jgi:hypothetical protein